jgi:hypothetical protein
LWYKSSTGEEEGQASGAYIFRPAKDAPVSAAVKIINDAALWQNCDNTSMFDAVV